MTSREQFEVWASNQYPFDPIESILLRIGPDKERYHLKVIQRLWEAWQASREAVEVELPEEMKAREALDKGFMCDYAAGVTDTVVQMRENLRAAGIKVKGE